jgi:hypothetical protein
LTAWKSNARETKGTAVARHHTLGTIKGVANRITRTAVTLSGKAVDKAVGEVSTRIAARRASTPDSRPAVAPEPAASPASPASRKTEGARTAAPSPADVARVVARHPEHRTRPATPAKRKPARTSVPGAKLPARSGQGILGV